MVGDHVVLFNPPGLTEKGCKIQVPWASPYVIVECLSKVGVRLRSLHGNRLTNSHVNRLRHFDSQRHKKTSDLSTGMWPQSRRIYRGIIEEEV